MAKRIRKSEPVPEDRPIALGDSSLGKLTFTGTVLVDSIDASLDAMQQVFPLEVHRSEHQVILIKRPK